MTDYVRGTAIGFVIAAILLGASASATSIAPALASPANGNWVVWALWLAIAVPAVWVFGKLLVADHSDGS